MNNPGVHKIYYIKKSLTSFPVYFYSGTVYNIAAYLGGSLTELEFEKGTFRMNGNTERSAAGKLVKTVVQFTVSGISNAIDTILSNLENEPHVFVFEDVEGQYFLFGTNHFRTLFYKNFSHEDPPSSKKVYQPFIELTAPFGLVFCTIS